MPAYIPVPIEAADCESVFRTTAYADYSPLPTPRMLEMSPKRGVSPVVSTVGPGSEAGSSIGFGFDDESSSGRGSEEAIGLEQDEFSTTELKVSAARMSFPPGLAPIVALPSRGSAEHLIGECRPCAWFYKTTGCENGQECGFCHMCPETALKERKKQKRAIGRQALVKADRASVQALTRSLNLSALL